MGLKHCVMNSLDYEMESWIRVLEWHIELDSRSGAFGGKCCCGIENLIPEVEFYLV